MRKYSLLMLLAAALCLAPGCGKKDSKSTDDGSGLGEGVVEHAVFERGVPRAITSAEEDLMKRIVSITFKDTPIEKVMEELGKAAQVTIKLDPAVKEGSSFDYFNQQEQDDLAIKWGRNPEANLKARKVSADFKDIPLDEALLQLSQASKTTIVLDPFSLPMQGDKPVMPRVSASHEQTDLFTVLTKLAESVSLRVQPYENTAIITNAGAGKITALFDVRGYTASAAELGRLLKQAFTRSGFRCTVESQPGRLIMTASPNMIEAVPSFLQAQKKKENAAAGAPLPRNISMEWKQQYFQTVISSICRSAGLYYSFRDGTVHVSNKPHLITPGDQSAWIKKLAKQFDTKITKAFTNAKGIDITGELAAKTGLTIEDEFSAFMEMQSKTYTIHLYEVKIGVVLDLFVLMAGLDYYITSKEVHIYKPRS